MIYFLNVQRAKCCHREHKSQPNIELFVRSNCYNKKRSHNTSGVFPLGISDHNLVYATLRLKSKRLPPKYVNTRNYKNLNLDSFREDIETAPFHIASVVKFCGCGCHCSLIFVMSTPHGKRERSGADLHLGLLIKFPI